MLIVNRSLQQSVIVEEFDGLELMLKVTVLGVRGKKVRLGFEVLKDDSDKPLKTWEQVADGEPIHVAKPSMSTTQEWDWNNNSKHGSGLCYDKKPVFTGTSTNQ